MNGIEVEAILFSHNGARNCLDSEVKRQLARTRYIEAQQQKVGPLPSAGTTASEGHSPALPGVSAVLAGA